MLIREGENIISTQNSYLLFNYFPIVNNNIYLALAKDVMNYLSELPYNRDIVNLDSYFLKIYYPLLFSTDNIKTQQELTNKGARLFDKEKNTVRKYYDAYNSRIDLFYNIFDNMETPNIQKKGIRYIHITVHPVTNIKLPLEVLFKILNSTNVIPLINITPVANTKIYIDYTRIHIFLKMVEKYLLYMLKIIIEKEL